MKRDGIYISRYHASVEATDRNLNIFSAVASSGSIAGWAVWHSAGIVWAIIIAASQVLTAVRPFLPYRTRLKALSGLGAELDGLAIAAENDWFKVSEGLLSEAEIHGLTMSLKRKILAATSKHFPETSLPPRKSLLDRAEAEAEHYMLRFAEEDRDV